MLLQIPHLLSAAQVAECRKALEGAAWGDGKATAGYLSSRVKDNVQLTENDPAARKLGGMILDVLDRNQLFISAALPLKVFPPLFNRYEDGGNFGMHIDTAVRYTSLPPHRVRTDISATLFLAGPEEYDGGELTVEDTYGVHKVKLPAGHLILYPASSLHRVAPITRGSREESACFSTRDATVSRSSSRSSLIGSAPPEHGVGATLHHPTTSAGPAPAIAEAKDRAPE